MRVVTTNDFVGSFFPQATSYGRLPGATALVSTVEALEGIWVDTGDLAQGSALGAVTDGAWPFEALRRLPIDVSVVGNHELDWGMDDLRRRSAELPFELLAANLPGFPATQRFGDTAVIGLTLPAMEMMHPGVSTEPVDVRGIAADLRSDGARHVVLAVHDGVDAPGATGRMESLCAGLRGAVDLVLGGHTLQCFAGELAGVPFLQPWAFGGQVGVADLHDDHVALRLVDVAGEQPFTAPGQAELEAEIVGRLDRPLSSRGGDSTLAAAIAGSLLDEADAVYLGPGDLWNQPARDGIHAHLPAGDVTMAQVLRLTPLTGARSVWGGQLVTASGATDVPGALTSRPTYPGGPPTGGTTAGHGDTVLLTTFQAHLADLTLGTRHDWRPVASTLRDALLKAVSR